MKIMKNFDIMEVIERSERKLYWRKWALEEMKKHLKLYAETKNKLYYENVQNLGIFAGNHKEEGIDRILSEKD